MIHQGKGGTNSPNESKHTVGTAPNLGNAKQQRLVEFKEFLDVVNERRPYCSSDFKKQFFIRDLSSI